MTNVFMTRSELTVLVNSNPEDFVKKIIKMLGLNIDPLYSERRIYKDDFFEKESILKHNSTIAFISEEDDCFYVKTRPGKSNVHGIKLGVMLVKNKIETNIIMIKLKP